MTQALNTYDPIFYAQEGLSILKNSLGFANRCYRGFERQTKVPGSVISISMPQEFVATAAPAAATDLAPGEVQITLDGWDEVKFKLTDKELALTRDSIITDHIAPAIYALALKIETGIATKMYQKCGWQNTASSPADVEDIVSLRKLMFSNKCPMLDGQRYLAVDGTIGSEFLQLSAFSQYIGAGEAGAATQRDGSLGSKFGFGIFETQILPTHTAGSLSVSGTLQVNAAAALNATSLVFKASSTTLTGDIHAGDFFTIAGDDQAYAVTATATASGNLVTVSISPALQVAVSGNEEVTLTQTSGDIQLAFHRNSTALAMAPLSTMGNELGAKIEVATDPDTGISLRARQYYIGDSSVVAVAYDALYGVQVLRPNMIARLLNA